MTIKIPRLSRIATLDEYFAWLCDLVELDLSNGGYSIIAEILYNKEFVWSVPNDDNRAFEGRNLREQFCDNMGIEFVYDYFDFECSMLELLISLAYRCESIMPDIPMKDWFWKMLSNTGLDQFTDDMFKHTNNDYVVDEKISKIIERRYGRNGKGGLFPLERSRKDQRKVELWYQMNAYLMENYYSDDMI